MTTNITKRRVITAYCAGDNLRVQGGQVDLIYGVSFTASINKRGADCGTRGIILIFYK